MKADKILDYYYDFNNYKVLITYKRMRNIVYRLNQEEGCFKISAPFYTSDKKILKYLDKFAPKLIKKSLDKKSPVNGDLVYIFGKQYPITLAKSNRLFDDHVTVRRKDRLNVLLKRVLLNYLNERVKYYENLMNIKPYKISVKNMHTRHGSNNKHRRHLSFALSLVHYKYPVIDSVIIHELAHDTYFDHSPSFYDLLYKYCPDYKQYKKALDSTKYEFEIDQQN